MWRPRENSLAAKLRQPLYALGREVLRKKGWARNVRHNMINQVNAAFARMAGRVVHVEQAGFFADKQEEDPQPATQEQVAAQPATAAAAAPVAAGPKKKKKGANRRMDVVEFRSNGTMNFLDTTVRDGALPAEVKKKHALLYPERHLKKGEADKDKTYKDRPTYASLTTFAVCTQGAVGPEGRTWLEGVAMDKLRKERGIMADIKPHMKQKVVWNVLMEIGVTLMRTQADQIALHATTATLPLKSKRKPARAR